MKVDEDREFIVNGTLIAIGTLKKPIVFTSNKTSKAADDWGPLYFAPTSRSARLYSEEIEKKRNTYVFLGIGNKNRRITGLTPDAPAEKAGLIKGETIVKINNVTIHNDKGLKKTLSSYKPGDKVNVHILRHGKLLTKIARLMHRNDWYKKRMKVKGDDYIYGCILKWCVIEYGRGVAAYRSSPYIANNIIKYHSHNKGGGIRIREGHSTIKENKIRFCFTKDTGGGIQVVSAPRTQVVGNVIEYNRAESGGGIAAECDYLDLNKNYDFTVHNNIVRNNNANYKGGGIAILHSQGNRIYQVLPSIVGNEIIHNSAGVGDGMYIMGQSMVESNLIVNDRGAGLFIEDTYRGWAEFKNNLIAFNQNTKSGGGVLFKKCKSIG